MVHQFRIIGNLTQDNELALVRQLKAEEKRMPRHDIRLDLLGSYEIDEVGVKVLLGLHARLQHTCRKLQFTYMRSNIRNVLTEHFVLGPVPGGPNGGYPTGPYDAALALPLPDYYTDEESGWGTGPA